MRKQIAGRKEIVGRTGFVEGTVFVGHRVGKARIAGPCTEIGRYRQVGRRKLRKVAGRHTERRVAAADSRTERNPGNRGGDLRWGRRTAAAARRKEIDNTTFEVERGCDTSWQAVGRSVGRARVGRVRVGRVRVGRFGM